VVKQTGDQLQTGSEVPAVMMYLGAILFLLFFVMIAPQSRTFVLGLATAAGAFIADWAPFSYVLVLILVAVPFVVMYMVHTAPQRVDPENPMAKYRREMPLDEE
jgi:cell division protein FtsW (lipid II flippase)